MESTIPFRKETVSEIESLPKISKVKAVREEGEHILKVTPDTIKESDRDQIQSILKSIIPNYIDYDSPDTVLVAVHYEKSTNTYRIFATVGSEEKENDKLEIRDDVLDKFKDDDTTDEFIA